MKQDGYRALAIKTGGKVQLRSRNDNDFNGRYPLVVKALAPLPDKTMIDGKSLRSINGENSPMCSSGAGTVSSFVFGVLGSTSARSS